MVAIDRQGIPLTGLIASASTSEYHLLLPTIDTISIQKKPLHPITKTQSLIADRGYDAKWVRQALRKRGIIPYIPKRRKQGKPEEPPYNTKISPWYKIRWIMERTIAWLGNQRRILIRWEKYSSIYKAFFQLACILICLNWVLK